MPTTHELLSDALEHQRAGRLGDAETIYRGVLERDPENPDALHLLGVLESRTGRAAMGVGRIARAIQLNPAAPFYHNNLGNVLQDLGRFGDSVLCYSEALRLEPDYADAYLNLGNALNRLGRFGDAVRCYLESQRLKPDNPELYLSLGDCLRDHGLLDDALGCFEEALRLDPEHAEAHCARATAWLALSDFARGWEEYEWRWRVKTYPRREFAQPPWDGSPLEGRTILLYSEQGQGDAIQFVRYAAAARQAGGRVVLECQPRLAPLMARMPAVDVVVPRGAELPRFDVHAPLLSLPHLFSTTLQTIPGEAPYLEADPERVARWRTRVAGHARGRRAVGIVWAGSPAQKKDYARSARLADFAPLARVSGIALFSLQRGAAAELACAPPGMEIENLEEDGGDILDTAAAIACLDLVISVDTMAVHLAGALAKRVWVLLAFAPDWRWMLGRDDSPWYPTARLCRQAAPGDWAELMDRVARELAS